MALDELFLGVFMGCLLYFLIMLTSFTCFPSPPSLLHPCKSFTRRIFGHDQSNSREVYTAKRMQRVFSVLFSADNRYVFSGSDDTNIRAWKARASESLAVQTPREQAASNYQQALKQRYAHMPEIKRISKHRILPIAIHKQKIERSIMHASKKRKEENRDRTNRMKGKKPKPSEIEKRDPRKAKIVKIVK